MCIPRWIHHGFSTKRYRRSEPPFGAAGTFDFGFAERITVGPIDPVSGHSTVFVATSTGVVYQWVNPQSNWVQVATQPSGFAVGEPFLSPTGNENIPVAKLVYEPYDYNWNVPANPLFMLGIDGHVYRAISGSFDHDTGISNAKSLSYSPSYRAVIAMTDDGVMWRWQDASNSWGQLVASQTDVSRFLSGAGIVSDITPYIQRVSGGLFTSIGSSGYWPRFTYGGTFLTPSSHPTILPGIFPNWPATLQLPGTFSAKQLGLSIDSDFQNQIIPRQIGHPGFVIEGSAPALFANNGRLQNSSIVFGGPDIPSGNGIPAHAHHDVAWVLTDALHVMTYYDDLLMPNGAMCAVDPSGPVNGDCEGGYCSEINGSVPGVCTVPTGFYSIPSCMSPLGAGWGVACRARTIWRWTWNSSSGGALGAWSNVPGPSGVTTVSVDLNGNPWVIDSAGQIYKWNGSAFIAFGPISFVASSVASGSGDAETYAINASDHTIWRYSPLPRGHWLRMSATQTATKIAVFSTPNGCALPLIHDPWIIDSNHNIYKGANVNCGGSVAFSQALGSALEITTDFIKSTDGLIYAWDPWAAGWSHHSGSFSQLSAAGKYGDRGFFAIVNGTQIGAVESPSAGNVF
jgi:hypothetical protein